MKAAVKDFRRSSAKKSCERKNKIRSGGIMDAGLLAVGAGLAVGLAAIGTGLAQARIGAAGAGAVAEKPELIGSMIVLLAIPETMIILGFAVAAIILFVK
jgi:V/A-type H+-transporting ATPase subunit K